jgi:hypothetical protein
MNIIEENSEEHNFYMKLTSQQKDIVDALKNAGFKYKYFSHYECEGGSIDVNKIKRLSELIEKIYELGKNHKLWQIQRVLGINN